jgi:hypothetical protein
VRTFLQSRNFSLFRAALGIVAAGAMTSAVQATDHYPHAPANVHALLRSEGAANEACRGGSDGRATDRACARRDALDKKIEAQGWCYGEGAEDGAHSHWAACSPPTVKAALDSYGMAAFECESDQSPKEQCKRRDALRTRIKALGWCLDGDDWGPCRRSRSPGKP